MRNGNTPMKLTLRRLAFPVPVPVSGTFAPLSAKLTGQVQALRLQPTAQTRPRPAQTPKESGELNTTSPHLPIHPQPKKQC